MSDYLPGLSAIALPTMHHVRQDFPAPQVADVAAAVRAAVAVPEIAALLRPGLRVALAVGSRGLADLATIVATLVAVRRQRGCEVTIVPAMGSHGGATAEGQVAVLAGYGITAAAVGAPIVAT